MPNDYIPSRDADSLAWMQTFAGGIQSDPARYFLAPVQAAAIQAAVDLFAAAYADAIDPAPKFDPETTRKTRELRDVYLEHLNTQQIPALGKYEVGRNGDGKILSALSSNAPALRSESPIAA